MAVIQLVTRAPGARGVWVRRRAGSAAGTPEARPGQHRARASRRRLAFSTERDRLIEISYPQTMTPFTAARSYFIWIAAALWIAATAVFVMALKRFYWRRA